MSFAAAVDHLHALGLELAPAPGPTAASNPSAPDAATLAAHAPHRKFDLDHMRILARALGDPQKQFPALLIAGTNGKGSTAATLASILAAAGYRTGLYTSPHLSRVTERIRTSAPVLRSPFSVVRSEKASAHAATTDNEQRTRGNRFSEIPEETFARLYFRVDDAARQLVSNGQLPHHPSFFESLTALAFLYFAEQGLEIAILEVGLGGRLDATNIVEPILSVITDIALDHQDYLGNTIAEIAREKAGILRRNGTLITLPQHPEANQAIGEAAIALNVRGINAAEYLPGRDAPHAFRRSSRLQPAESDTEMKRALAPGPFVMGAEPCFEASVPPEIPLASSPLTPNHYDLILEGEHLNIRSPLAGQHQQRNIALAIAAAIQLRNQQSYKSEFVPLEPRASDLEPLYRIPNSAIEAGVANTAWPGRLEFLPPNLILDVAHNPAGAWTLRAAIATLPEHQPRTLIFSCLRDKDLTEMAQILFPLFDSVAPPLSSSRSDPSLSSHSDPTSSSRSATERSASPSNPDPRNSNLVHHIILTPIDNPRAASLDDLLAAAHALDIPAHPAQDPTEALALARLLTPADGLILATGSIYLIGALREAVHGR